ncbi:MAG: NAD-dependent epimerase/dehydratase family protein [Pseudomonadota bacterium]
MTSPNKTIAVTGGTGFIGASLLSQLRDEPLQIRALTRRDQADRSVEWIKGELDNDGALKTLVANADIVIHIAGLTKAPNRKTLFSANAEAAGRLARHAAAAGVTRFVLVSSLAAREPRLSPYAASKRGGEDAVRAQKGDMEVVIVRPPAIIGPGDDATAQLLDAMKRGWLPVPGGATRKETRLSFMYVDDIARFILRQVDEPYTRHPLEPVSEIDGISWQMLATTASAILSKPVRQLPVSPVILFPAAFLTEAVCALFGKSTFFNTGKVREMLHSDWTGSNVMDGARPFKDSLALAFGQDIANDEA